MTNSSQGKKKQSFLKAERLCSKKAIDTLFSKGITIKAYPLLVKYEIKNTDAEECTKILISVPKRNFKRAVDRNLIKRKIREAYRVNKHLIETLSKENIFYHIAYIYVGKMLPSYQEIENKLIDTLERLVEQHT